MNAAVVLVAAGKSSRMGGGRNKVFLSLNGKPVLSYSLRVCDTHPSVKTIVVVGREEDQAEMEPIIDASVSNTRTMFVSGGMERFDSVKNGVLALRDQAPDAVLVHDAARPFLQPRFIDESLAALSEVPGAVVGVPLKDTLKRVDEGANVQETCDRTQYWLAQTPQTFRYVDIQQAYEKTNPPPYPTDDGQVLELQGGTVRMIPGSYQNMKITTPEDVALAESLMRIEAANALS